ncbi:MAG: DUF1569 domain-containing protein [Chitinophagaceae bacterium]|nr:DUF1569 domain-containing protein [Chitinophagaceae bacterium]
MKDLFDPSAYQEILARIDRLTPDSKPLWGKMNVGQMLSHLQAPAAIGLGDVKLKQRLIGLLFGRIAKKKLFGDKPFKHNLPTDPSFVRDKTHDFETEKQKLKALLKRFHEGGAEAITKDPHPFFGKLSTEEWSSFSYKHLDHHLQQFGV